MLKTMLGTAALMTALTVPSITIAAEAAPSYDTYKSWFVACDNGLACEARGFKDDGSSDTPDLSFSRDAGPEAETLVTLKIPFLAEASDLKVDGAPLSLQSGAWEVEREDTFTTLSLRGEEAVANLISQLRNSDELQTNDAEAVIPLNGIVAALLRMDDRQGRIGGVTALVRKGKAPASAVPSAPDLPSAPIYNPGTPLKAGEDARLIARARKDLDAVFASEECNTEMSNDVKRSEAFALDDTHALAIVACNMGAYQGSSLVAIVPRSENKPAQLLRPTRPIHDDSDMAALIDPTFDPPTGMLMLSERGRGLADCGMAAQWTWDGEQFRLIGASYQMACGGSEPGDWPTVYRSR